MLPVHILYVSSLLSRTFSNCLRRANLTWRMHFEILPHGNHVYKAVAEAASVPSGRTYHKHGRPPPPAQGHRGPDSPSSWLAEEVVRLNCCSRYFPKKAAKPATTAISMQAARVMQVNTGLESRCLVTFGITAGTQVEGQGHTHCTPQDPFLLQVCLPQ